jgi:hypothetical protein
LIGTLAAAPKTVTLNLFQGPSGRMHRAGGMRAVLAGLLAIPYAARAEKWTLKQVQGDKENKSRENIPGVEFVR